MGAEYCTMVVKGQSKVKARREFKKAQEDDLYENGHSYSGGFGMATGLEFKNMTFESEEKADEYLVDKCQKWENAIAVTFKNTDGKLDYLIAAWCSS